MLLHCIFLKRRCSIYLNSPIRKSLLRRSDSVLLAEAERRHEIMKRSIQQYVVQENQVGLSNQEQFLFKSMIKQFHQTIHEAHTPTEPN